MNKIPFNKIEDVVPRDKPGIYEIHTIAGVPLKVGISGNLRKRLLQHRASRQSGLRLKPSGDFSNPSDVKSKASILAKHLYFDRTITAEYDLTNEAGRRSFLQDRCYIIFEVTKDRVEARDIERQREENSSFRYVGECQVR
ncbi:hypothetical protein ACI2T9_23160 [Ralstonia nicotianae]